MDFEMAIAVLGF